MALILYLGTRGCVKMGTRYQNVVSLPLAPTGGECLRSASPRTSFPNRREKSQRQY